MWKSVENLPAGEQGRGTRLRVALGLHDGAQVEQALRACSACAGNYEDPDRTAPATDADGADEVEELDDSVVGRGVTLDCVNGARANSDEFPAKET